MDRKSNKRKDIALIFLIIILSSFAWRLLPRLIAVADGLYYLISDFQESFFTKPYFYTGFETSAYLFGTLFSKWFGVKMSLYFWAELVVMAIINAVFYLTVLSIFKKRLVAFFAALFFSVNYFGNWNMYTNHCYCFFLERIINVPFLIASFLFLHLFLERSKIKYYIFSLVFYFLGLGLAHFALLFTPLYVLYPIFWFLFKGKNKKDFFHGGIIGISYLALSAFFVLIQQINESGIVGRHEFLDFLLHPEKYYYFEKMLRQLVYWSQYFDFLIKGFTAANPLQLVEDVSRAISITPLIVIIYSIAGFVIYKKLPQMRALLFTTIFSTAGIFYLNAYFGQYEVLNQPGANRYLYFPTFLLTIFWALFFWAAFWRKKKFKKWRVGMGIFILIVYYFVSLKLISEGFKVIFEYQGPVEAVYNSLIEEVPLLEKETLVVIPYPQVSVRESEFFTDKLGRNGEIKIISNFSTSLDQEVWQEEALAWPYVVKFDYNEDCQCIVKEVIK